MKKLLEASANWPTWLVILLIVPIITAMAMDMAMQDLGALRAFAEKRAIK